LGITLGVQWCASLKQARLLLTPNFTKCSTPKVCLRERSEERCLDAALDLRRATVSDLRPLEHKHLDRSSKLPVLTLEQKWSSISVPSTHTLI